MRYGIASAAFIAIALLTGATLRTARGHIWLVAGAALALLFNQLALTYAVKSTSASVIALILASVPIFAAVIGLALRTEQLSRRFWVGARRLVPRGGARGAGTGGEFRQDRQGGAARHRGRRDRRDPRAADPDEHPLVSLLDRIGPARATLATNLQPLLAAPFAVALRSESLSLVQVAGRALIAGGILAARRRASSVVTETPLVS